MNETVAVLGGGMIGVCCALELLQRGADVTLIDRRSPGQETSYGNAGIVTRSSLVPFNNPGIWAHLPRLLTNRTASLRYDFPFLLRNLGWTFRFLCRARAKPFEETVKALDALIRYSEREHRRLVKEANVSQRLRDSGWLFLYRSFRGYAQSALAREVFDRFGIRTETLDPCDLRDLEPALKPIFAKALWVRDAYSIDDPGALVGDYAKMFVDHGGRISKREIRQVRKEDRVWAILDSNGNAARFNRIVVALGPWSKDFLNSMDVKVPMLFERGYHQHFDEVGNERLGRPVCDVSGGYVLTPTERGLRLTTGIELNSCDAPANFSQLNQAVTSAREAIAMGRGSPAPPWLGRRPTLPDSRPMIGELPSHKGLWLAFGHQHIGFSTGPGTARILADQMTGRSPPIDPTPFRPERFLN